MNIIPSPFNVTAQVVNLNIFLPENGVAELSGSSPLLPRASAGDSPHPRPHVLGSVVSGPAAAGVGQCSTVLDHETWQLIMTFLRDFTQLSAPQWNQSAALTTVKRVVVDLLEKHGYAFKGMVTKLSLETRGDDMSFIGEIAKSLFDDGVTNWGRITCLVAFGGVVSQDLNSMGRVDCVELVGREISTYLLSDQRDWLVRNNCWDGFVKFFQVPEPWFTVKNTFVALAGVGSVLSTAIRGGDSWTRTTPLKPDPPVSSRSLGSGPGLQFQRLLPNDNPVKEEKRFHLKLEINHHQVYGIHLPNNAEHLTLTIRDHVNTKVWAHEVDLTDSAVSEERLQRSQQNTTPEDKLSSVRPEFVKRVSAAVLNQLLDKLLQQRIITEEEMDVANTKYKHNKARYVIDQVRIKGRKPCCVLIAAIRELDPHLSNTLRLNM